ncbi:MAG: hypothetical protein ABIM85_00735, partial [candidate division WOR-3 bacterium]
SEINKQSEFIIETIKKTNPEIGNSINFKKEFKISENINLSFKDIEEIKRKLDEIFLGKLEEIFGKILARKKYETLKKKL